MKTDIYITERGGKGRQMTIPILPETIKCNSGDTTFFSYDIMNKGETAIPSGVALSSYSWESFFPGMSRDVGGLQHGGKKEPSAYHYLLQEWQKNGTSLNLLVTGYPINADVYIEKYQSEMSGGFGDIAYSISFKGERSLEVVINSTSSSTSTTKRNDQKNTTYTIKQGDTLWGIAQKELGKGSLWQTIYNANKTIIEQTAKKYGKSSSNNGWWIFPGITLTIPR